MNASQRSQAARPPASRTTQPPKTTASSQGSWQPDELLAERVERGRRLLAESEEHRGDADLQAWHGGSAPRRPPPPSARRHQPLAAADGHAECPTPPELQSFVALMDDSFALQRLLLDEAGEPRTNLSSREKEEAVSLFLHASLRNMLSVASFVGLNERLILHVADLVSWVLGPPRKGLASEASAFQPGAAVCSCSAPQTSAPPPRSFMMLSVLQTLPALWAWS